MSWRPFEHAYSGKERMREREEGRRSYTVVYSRDQREKEREGEEARYANRRL